MILLLDSHALFWVLCGSPEMSPRAREAAGDSRNRVYFSPVSCYELENKASRGKMPPFPVSIAELAVAEDYSELPVTAAHAERAARFALAHRDPWDRIIAAQALIEDITVITRDPAIAALGARTLW